MIKILILSHFGTGRGGGGAQISPRELYWQQHTSKTTNVFISDNTRCTQKMYINVGHSSPQLFLDRFLTAFHTF